MSKINLTAPKSTLPPLKPRTDSGKAAHERTVDAEKIDAENAVVSYEEMLGMSQEMSLELEQLGRRRTTSNRRAGPGSSPFERILEEESEPKVDSLQQIAHLADINKQQFLMTARSLFPDVSDFILVLRELIRRKKIKQADTLAFEAMMAEVWEQSDKKMCQAGLNVGLKARLFSKKIRVSAKALRDTYRQFLLCEDEQIFQYQQWVEEYGTSRRRQISEFIETSLIHDIQSHDPSCSRLEFGNLLGQLVKIKKLGAADHAFLDIFTRHNMSMLLLEDRLLECWFDCLQRPFQLKKEIETNHLATLTKTLLLPKETLRQKLLTAIKQLDDELFLEPEVRQILIDTLMDFQPSQDITVDESTRVQ